MCIRDRARSTRKTRPITPILYAEAAASPTRMSPPHLCTDTIVRSWKSPRVDSFKFPPDFPGVVTGRWQVACHGQQYQSRRCRPRISRSARTGEPHTMNQHGAPMRRRDLLKLIGSVARSSVMYQAMTTLGLSAESTYSGPIALDGNPKNASVLILGAGLAGMVAALELRNAGYKVQVLEYQQRAGGRCWTIRGGDRYTELGGAEQVCGFDKDLYLNPGPWRIPSHHHGVIDYCKRLGV